ncbi:FAD-binding oxidoreductase [Luteipulveratus sp. YIM 133132]|uniref:FAD-binding oxidoreductase n=1 Tax=Luteipulveratus flavus TaxID=3031728 RepID=UPI0023B1B317|nr:FAD-binding oxidoreductase [Luteipulveratus sp. YIM 133132]MDE9367777.1 FAD-binding oxidoreductase [Luteipulveratus sp. YIM 133132]
MTDGASTVGWDQHNEAVDHLRRQLSAVPQGEPVRLAKRSSNLFRPREGTGRPGLDVSALDGVIEVDPGRRTAQVQGMCTYEDLVDVALAHDLMPYVVPQLRTITLGGAVTGLGIESSSFRNGLPHESVREMDVLTGSGEILTVSRTEHEDLFRAFPNSYGSLGYSVRLEIDLEPVAPYVHLRHLHFDDLGSLVTTMGELLRTRDLDGEAVDFLDGVVFSATEGYLVVGSWSQHAPYTSDYTGRHIFYRSIQQHAEDYLTTRDYIWRWDTDWFWCSRAFGVQNPRVRPFVPKRFLRSDVYGKVIRFENRHQWWARKEARQGRLPRERVVQDVEIPLERTEEFLGWFLQNLPIEPIWLCPLAVRDQDHDEQPWPLYPLRVGEQYVNVGFWSTVEIPVGGKDGDTNKRIEQTVERLGGHKSLYSDAYYDEPTFWGLYGGETYQQVKKTYDPDGRLPDLYAKAVGRR